MTGLHPAFDPNTGEEIGMVAVPSLTPSRRRVNKPKREPFMMFTTRALGALDITGVQWRVLAILGSVRNKETLESRIMVKEIARRMDVPHTNVSRALSELASRGIVYKMGTGIYRINTNIAYVGDKLASSTDLIADPEPEWSRSAVHA